MGASSSKSKKRTVKNPVEQNWEVLDNQDTFKIVKSRNDGRLAE